MKVGEADSALTGSSLPVESTFQPDWRDNLYLNARLGMEQVKQWGKNALAAGALAVASSVAVYPVAKELAVENTSVEADVITAPAEISLTGSGWSSLNTGVFGSYYVPRSENGLGMSVQIKDMPAAGANNVQDFLSPQFRQLLTNYFHDPEQSIEGYADLLEAEAKERTLTYLLIGDLMVSSVVIAPLLLRKDWREHLNNHKFKTTLVAAGATTAALLASQQIADSTHESWAQASPAPEQGYAINGLEGTYLEGTVTSNHLLQLATNQAVPAFKKQIARQEAATNEFVDNATLSLLSQRYKMEGPRDGEIAYMPLADTHGVQAMLRMDKILLDTYSELFGSDAMAFITVSGDLTTNGTPAEKGLIEDVANLGKNSDIPVVAIAGDHETPVSISQMEELEMIIPDLTVEAIDEVKILGANDRAQKEFGGVNRTFIDDINEEELGKKVREIAETERPDIVLLHQGYAVMAFLNSEQTNKEIMHTFLGDNGPNERHLTEFRDDGIENVPTNAIYYGHWHDDAPVRVIWNKDSETGEITWTTVEELNTSGGAIGSPTFNRFSLPWYPPLQDAVIRINFMNEDSKLVTGYQLYTFKPDGTVFIAPRVEIGLPGGLPGQAVEIPKKPRPDVPEAKR